MSSQNTTVTNPKLKKRKENVFIEEISTVILEIIEENNKNPSKITKNIKIYEGERASSVPINKFISRLVKYSNTEPTSIVIALIYMDRLCEMSKIMLDLANFHRIFLISFVIAIKYNDDKYYTNSMYAKMGGISLNELNKLETYFLQSIEFFLFVENEIFEKYLNYLKSMVKLSTRALN